MILILKDITKSFNNNVVIENINLTIGFGTIYCLLGKNGAGKSTLINLISNVIDPDKGEINFGSLSYPENEIEIKHNIGLQSQFNQIIEELNAYDFLEWIGLLYGMPKEVIESQINKVLNYFFEESEKLYLPSKKYSEGMKKKLAICSAILPGPKLLILDEPFANLDLVASIKLCNFLNAYKSNERIILVSSHDLLYVDKIATHIGVINRKQLVFNGSLNEFKNQGLGTLDSKLLEYLTPENMDDALKDII